MTVEDAIKLVQQLRVQADALMAQLVRGGLGSSSVKAMNSTIDAMTANLDRLKD